MSFRKLLQIVERRGPTRDVVLALLDRDAKDKAFFADREKVQALADSLNTATRTASVQPDEEHQAHSLRRSRIAAAAIRGITASISIS